MSRATTSEPLTKEELDDIRRWTTLLPTGAQGIRARTYVLRLLATLDAARQSTVDWPTLANIIREVDGNHDLGAGELAERILAHPAMRAARTTTTRHSARIAMTHDEGETA